MHLQKVRMPQSAPQSPVIREKKVRPKAFGLSSVDNNSPQVSPVRKLAMGGDKNTPPPSPVRKTLAMGGENTPPPSPVRKTLAIGMENTPPQSPVRKIEMGMENTPPPSPSPNGMTADEPASPAGQGAIISKKSGSFSQVSVVEMMDGTWVAKKTLYVMGKKGKTKDTRGFQTNRTNHTIMPWKDWIKNRDAHAHSGPASMYFVKTMGITTIQDGGDDGLWIFEMTMEYVNPVLDFLASNKDQRTKIAGMYVCTLKKINDALLSDGVGCLEDIHPGNGGLRLLPDGTYELVFFDLQFSPIEKGINIPSEYVFETSSDLTDMKRKILKKKQAFLLMVESIRLYDPVRPRKEHVQEIARDLKIGCMSLEQVNRALDEYSL